MTFRKACWFTEWEYGINKHWQNWDYWCLKLFFFFTYCTAKTQKVLGHTLLVRLWGKYFFMHLLVGMQNGSISVIGIWWYLTKLCILFPFDRSSTRLLIIHYGQKTVSLINDVEKAGHQHAKGWNCTPILYHTSKSTQTRWKA